VQGIRGDAGRTYEGSLVYCDGFVLAFIGKGEFLETAVVGHGERVRKRTGRRSVDTDDVWRFAPGNRWKHRELKVNDSKFPAIRRKVKSQDQIKSGSKRIKNRQRLSRGVEGQE
jgi:hypothetical protein